MKEIEGKSIYSVNNKLNPLMQDGKFVCTATHPQQPNYSGKSRGRKIHLTQNQEKTICNMLVDELVPAEEGFEGGLWHQVTNGKCKICYPL